MLFKKKSVLALAMAASMLLGACNTTTGSNPAPAPAPAAPAASSGEANASGEPAAAAPTGEKVLHINNHEEPGSLNPALAQGTHESWIIDHMFEGLYNKTPDGIENGLAEDVTTSDDGLVWTFKLAQDGKWSNGDPVVAKDFEASWKWCLNPASAAQYASMLYVLQGAEAYNSSKETDPAKLQELEDAVGVKAIDDYTLEVTLVSAMPYFPDYVTHYTFYPVNHKVQAEDIQWSTKPSKYVSNGPFVLTAWTNKVSMTCSKNPNYRHKDSVKIDRIEWSMDADQATEWQKYQQGELDISFPLLPAVIEQLQNANDPELQILPDLSIYYYLFNCEKKPFNNAKVRKALSMAVNREALVKNVTKGGQQPAFGVTSPGIFDGTGDYQESLGPLFSEDIEGAKVLLAEGLQEEGMDISNFSFALLFNTNDTHKKIAEAVQAMWKQNLGINVTLENAEFQVVLDRRDAADYDVCRAGWIGDYADPLTFLDYYMTNHSQNDSHWSNPAFDKLIQDSMLTTDMAERMSLLSQAEKILIGDEHVVMPLYFYTKPLALKPHVKDMFVPVNRYPDFTLADIVR